LEASDARILLHCTRRLPHCIYTWRVFLAPGFPVNWLGSVELDADRIWAASLRFSLQRAFSVRQKIIVCGTSITPRASACDEPLLFEFATKSADRNRILVACLGRRRFVARRFVHVLGPGRGLFLLRMASLPGAPSTASASPLQIPKEVSPVTPS